MAEDAVTKHFRSIALALRARGARAIRIVPARKHARCKFEHEGREYSIVISKASGDWGALRAIIRHAERLMGSPLSDKEEA